MTQVTSLQTTTGEAREAAAFYAKHAVASKAFAGIANESAAIIKIELGRELGMSAIASLQGIMFNERGGFTLSATLQGACLQRHGYSWRVIKLTDAECHLDIYRAGEKIGESTLTMAQAKAAKMCMQWDSKAGAWKDKATWQSFPRNMLFARCLTNAVKWFAPEVLAGVPMYDPDELDGLPPRESGAGAGDVIDHDEAKRQAEERKAQAQTHSNGNGKPATDLKPVSSANRLIASQLHDRLEVLRTVDLKAASDEEKAKWAADLKTLMQDVNAQLTLRGLDKLRKPSDAKDAWSVVRSGVSILIDHDQAAPVADEPAVSEFDGGPKQEIPA